MKHLPKTIIRQLVADSNLGQEISEILDENGEMYKNAQSDLHKRMISAQHLLSLVASIVSDHPKLDKKFTRVITKAEEEYMPSYPPMSPITESYFTLWTLCDFAIDVVPPTTAGQFVPAFSQRFKLPGQVVSDCRAISDSRMGFYEVISQKKSIVEAREIPTQEPITFECHSGYEGREGEIWFLRIGKLPPGNISLTTPYVIQQPMVRPDIEAFFERQGISSSVSGDDKKFRRLMKRPKEKNFWHEYIFCGYTGYESGAVFLTGVPDIPETLPHSGSFVSKQAAC
ncbi:hypothetical protein MRY87_10865 [bacterium]|nr:hypothetical protein [bacterium]